ncbi:TPA: hypothetical protein ACX6RV_001044 [Photobacterium damselae]
MSSTRRGKTTFLELVFPPISNYEAHHLQGQPAAELMKQSDFYMIGGKPKSKFMDVSLCEETGVLNLDIYIGDVKSSNGAIAIDELPYVMKFLETEDKQVGISFGEDAVEIFYKQGCERLLLERFTPENILWHRSRNHAGVSGFDNFQELFRYDLLYVGIAKKGDSYQRLIKDGHHARMKILSNEPQRYPGARVTDEIFLFLFRLEPLYITSFGTDETEFDMDFGYDHKQIVADAEKAFVSLLQPEYNTVKFKQYPQGKDGLFDSKLDNYSYSIGEFITFNTPHGEIKGARNEFTGGLDNKADFIFIDKKTSNLFVANE